MPKPASTESTVIAVCVSVLIIATVAAHARAQEPRSDASNDASQTVAESQDQRSADPDVKPETAEAAPKSDAKPDSDAPAPRPLSDDDRNLLKKLLPGFTLPGTEPTEPQSEGADGSVDDGPDELDRAVSSMREVSRRLDQKDISGTREMQVGIIKDIDALIERLKNQPPPQSRQSSSQNSQDQQQNQQQDQSQQQNAAQQRRQQAERERQQQAQQQTQGTGAEQRRSDQASDSSETTLRDRERQAREMEARRALVNEVWGHLPPAMRERLLNVGSEKLLPRYEDQIRRYYESLAEPDTNRASPR